VAPFAAHSSREAVAHQLGTLARHELRRDAEPGVVVDTGQGFGGGAVGEQETPNHALCHNSMGEPRSHRFQLSTRRRLHSCSAALSSLI